MTMLIHFVFTFSTLSSRHKILTSFASKLVGLNFFSLASLNQCYVLGVVFEITKVQNKTASSHETPGGGGHSHIKRTGGGARHTFQGLKERFWYF